MIFNLCFSEAVHLITKYSDVPDSEIEKTHKKMDGPSHGKKK